MCSPILIDSLLAQKKLERKRRIDRRREGLEKAKGFSSSRDIPVENYLHPWRGSRGGGEGLHASRIFHWLSAVIESVVTRFVMQSRREFRTSFARMINLLELEEIEREVFVVESLNPRYCGNINLETFVTFDFV